MRQLLIFFIIVLMFTGCDDNITDKSIDIPSANVSYSQHIAPLFQLKCNSSSCHADGVTGRPVLTSYHGVTKDLSIVMPGEPETSRLVWAIEWRSGSVQMPPPGSPGLTSEQIIGIKAWIKEGAKNN